MATALDPSKYIVTLDGFPLNEGLIAEDGISITPAADISAFREDISGGGAHLFTNSKAYTVTLKYIQTSPTVTILSELSSLKTTHAMTITYIGGGTGTEASVFFSPSVAFARKPDFTIHGREVQQRDWTFNCLESEPNFTGVVQALVPGL